jgi:hypothetical protein
MCGVETLQDNGVKDDFSIHVLKDVAISSAFLASLRNDNARVCTFYSKPAQDSFGILQ